MPEPRERNISVLLEKILYGYGWKKSTSKRFMEFLNSFPPSEKFDERALLEGVTFEHDQREPIILKRYWGISQDCETLKSIAEDYCLTVERVRQIKVKATRKMQHPTRAFTVKKNLEEMGFSI